MTRAAARGLVVRRFAPWRDALSLESVPVPEPGPGEVLIAVEAASLNASDLLLIRGVDQRRPALPFVPGRDAAGVVVGMGADVTGLDVGDRVVALVRHGAFASRLLAPADRVLKIPIGLPARSAAAAATAFGAAHVALNERGRVRAGEKVLVTGAAGGVGTAAIQVAVAMGAQVVALVSSGPKAALAERLGAAAVRIDGLPDPGVGLHRLLWEKGFDPFDLVVEIVGGACFMGALRCLSPGGRLVAVGFASGLVPSMKADDLVLQHVAVLGSSLDEALRSTPRRIGSALRTIFGAMAEESFDPCISAVFPLERLADAAGMMESRTLLGKVVLEIV
jgi:NADPH2:quinone reductase